MVGQSDSANDALFDGNVFARGDSRRGALEGRKTKNEASRLVSKEGCDVFGCDRLREAANMGVAEFSNIGSGGRDDKNTALISGMFDGYFVLRFLNWIKSS